MSKFHYSTREIGGVAVFDLKGEPTFESVQEVAWKIQKSIRRHQLQPAVLQMCAHAGLQLSQNHNSWPSIKTTKRTISTHCLLGIVAECAPACSESH